jgi:predicted metal-binding protein
MVSDTPKIAVVTVCVNCRDRETTLDAAPGKALLEAVQAAAQGIEGVTVRPTQCLSVCNRICSAALSSEGGYTFVFGDLDAQKDAAALVSMASACCAAPHGFVPWKERPEALRKGIVARIPPLDWSPDDGSAPA